jgi:hypothetical protein
LPPRSCASVFVINVGDRDVIDVDRRLRDGSSCEPEVMTWRYRAATQSVNVVYEANGLFRCVLESFTVRIDRD